MNIDRLFDKKLRQTGRTTRMLEKAKKLAQEGRSVYIIAANKEEQGRLERLLGGRNYYPGISVETPITASNFNWYSMSLLGAHPNCVVLVDHYAVEDEVRRRLFDMRNAIESTISDQEKAIEEEFLTAEHLRQMASGTEIMVYWAGEGKSTRCYLSKVDGGLYAAFKGGYPIGPFRELTPLGNEPGQNRVLVPAEWTTKLR